MRAIIRLFCIGLVVLLVGTAHAQTKAYPDKSIRLLVGYSPGGGMDTIARVLAQRLEENLGVSVVVENRPGATSTLAAAAVAQAEPDGYTLLLGETGLLLAPVLLPSMPFDLKKSFMPVGYVAQIPMAFAVTNSFPAKTTQELIATLKADPQEIRLCLARRRHRSASGLRAVQARRRRGRPARPLQGRHRLLAGPDRRSRPHRDHEFVGGRRAGARQQRARDCGHIA